MNIVIKMEFTLDEINLIQAALRELPFKISADLIYKIKEEGDRQFKEQNQ